MQIVENEQGRVNIEVVKQLHFIQHELENGMAEQQQELFPEGLIFAHTNYALAWIDVLKTVKKDSDLYKNGKAEILKSLQILNENSTKSIFSANLQPENGVFYNGWKAYIQGKYLELEHKDTAVLNDFRTTCTSIADAFERISFHCIGNHSFLESYEKQIWVADNIVAIAALKRYAVLENDEKIKYRVQYWVEELEKIYENKLISHTVDAGMGFEVEGARGCSQSLILCFYPN